MEDLNNNLLYNIDDVKFFFSLYNNKITASLNFDFVEEIFHYMKNEELVIFLRFFYNEIKDIFKRELYTGITYAIEQDKSINIIKAIVDCGEDINELDGKYQTPLLSSILNGKNVCFIEEILKLGANTNKRCGLELMSPLHFACRKGTVNLLLKYGANVNDTDNRFGMTPLMNCLKRKYEIEESVIFELLLNGADVNYSDYDHNKVLFYAHEYNHNFKIIKTLIDFGAEINKKI